MQRDKNELRKPLGFKFFAWSWSLFFGVAACISELANLQPDLAKFAVLMKGNRWNLVGCWVLWTVMSIVVECVRRQLELQRESRRSSPKQPREAAKRAEVMRRRRQSVRQRGR